MKIKMLCSLTGEGRFLSRGQEYDLPDTRALELLNARYAVPVVTKDKREKAVKLPSETR